MGGADVRVAIDLVVVRSASTLVRHRRGAVGEGDARNGRRAGRHHIVESHRDARAGEGASQSVREHGLHAIEVSGGDAPVELVVVRSERQRFLRELGERRLVRRTAGDGLELRVGQGSAGVEARGPRLPGGFGGGGERLGEEGTLRYGREVRRQPNGKARIVGERVARRVRAGASLAGLEIAGEDAAFDRAPEVVPGWSGNRERHAATGAAIEVRARRELGVVGAARRWQCAVHGVDLLSDRDGRLVAAPARQGAAASRVIRHVRLVVGSCDADPSGGKRLSARRAQQGAGNDRSVVAGRGGVDRLDGRACLPDSRVSPALGELGEAGRRHDKLHRAVGLARAVRGDRENDAALRGDEEAAASRNELAADGLEGWDCAQRDGRGRVRWGSDADQGGGLRPEARVEVDAELARVRRKLRLFGQPVPLHDGHGAATGRDERPVGGGELRVTRFEVPRAQQEADDFIGGTLAGQLRGTVRAGGG
jgi:hypothetical protein